MAVTRSRPPQREAADDADAPTTPEKGPEQAADAPQAAPEPERVEIPVSPPPARSCVVCGRETQMVVRLPWADHAEPPAYCGAHLTPDLAPYVS